MSTLWREIKGFIWWTYERGTLRYDLMVILILAFIFAAPRSWFDDRPPQPTAGQIRLLADGSYQLDARLLASENNNSADTMERLLESHTGKSVNVVRWETKTGAGGRPEAYLVWIER